MSVDLSPDIWNEIQRQVATGVFATLILSFVVAVLRGPIHLSQVRIVL